MTRNGPLVLLPFACAALLACGEDGPTDKPVPSAAQVRSFLGINPESCSRYIFGQNQYARVSYGPANSNSILGRTVYIRSYLTEATTQPDEWFLDSETAGEVHLLRSTEGTGTARTTRRYDAMPEPLFAKLVFDKANKAGFAVGDKFEAETTPSELIGTAEPAAGMIEKHTWQVTLEKMVSTPDGMEMAFELEYRLQRGASAPVTSLYTLVPNKGVAAFTDFSGRRHQVCAWRTCTEAGVCSGPACDQLTCQ